jgi:hypothetical protein
MLLASSNRLATNILLVLLLLCVGACAVVVRASPERIALAQQQAEVTLAQERWWVPDWYRRSIDININEYNPPSDAPKVCEGLVCKRDSVVKHSYFYTGTLASIAIFHIFAFCFYKITNLDIDVLKGWMIGGNIVAMSSVPVLWIFSYILGGGNTAPWHFSVFVGYIISASAPLLLYLYALVATVITSLRRWLTEALTAGRQAREERARRAAMKAAEKSMILEDQRGQREDRTLTVHDRIRSIEIAAGLLVGASRDAKEKLDQQLLFSVVELTGYEETIRSDRTIRESISNIIELLDQIDYNKQSMQYRKLKSIVG